MKWFIFELFRVYFLRFWIDLGAIELIDQVQPSFAFQAAFSSLSQFTVHGLKFQKSYRDDYKGDSVELMNDKGRTSKRKRLNFK